jgi:hypothetical protein
MQLQLNHHGLYKLPEPKTPRRSYFLSEPELRELNERWERRMAAQREMDRKPRLKRLVTEDFK